MNNKIYNILVMVATKHIYLILLEFFGKMLTITKLTVRTNGGNIVEILKAAVAGTLESSDAMVTVEPGTIGIILEISSSVMNQYGRQIKNTVLETLERLEVKNARVTVVDKGALDCTLKARVECAVFRSSKSEGNIPWGGAVR